WNRDTTSARCRNSWGTRTWPRRRSIRMCSGVVPAAYSARSIASSRLRGRQWQPAHRLDGAQHEAGVHVAHARAGEYAVQKEAGEMLEVGHHHLQQVVHVTGQGVAGDDFVPLVHAAGEVGHGGGVVVVEAD